MDKSQWPRCLLWHGWLPPLSGAHGASPWAETEEEVGRNQLETSMGSHSVQTLLDWDHAHDFDAESVVRNVPHPNVWSGWSLVSDAVSGASSAGSGMYARISGNALDNEWVMGTPGPPYAWCWRLG